MYSVQGLVEAKNGWFVSGAYSLFLHQEAKKVMGFPGWKP